MDEIKLRVNRITLTQDILTAEKDFTITTPQGRVVFNFTNPPDDAQAVILTWLVGRFTTWLRRSKELLCKKEVLQ